MVSIRNFALVASAIIGFTSARPAITTRDAAKDFVVRLQVTDGNLVKYNGYALETYHTGAGTADPVFAPGNGTTAFLNGTNLQFDAGQGSSYPFAAFAGASDTNYARWEPASIGISYGSQNWVDNGPDGLEVTDSEFGGWIACEWFHSTESDVSAPQLFQVIKGFRPSGPDNYPSSCSTVLLFPEYQ